MKNISLLLLVVGLCAFSYQFYVKTAGAIFLWLFPLVHSGATFALWAFLTVFVVSTSTTTSRLFKLARNIVFLFGLPVFCAIQGVWWLGVIASAFPLLLYVLFQSKLNLGMKKISALLSVVFVIFIGHITVLPEPGMAGLLQHGRFALSFLGILFVYKIISYEIAILYRAEKIDFPTTVEYFLSPVFWISPNHATMITISAMQSRISRTEMNYKEKIQAIFWILRGIVQAWLFVYVVKLAKPVLEETYARKIYLREDYLPLFFIGALLFVVSYLEKSRVNYFVADLLRLSGFSIKPDFQNPLLAKNFLCFWRRYHSWVLDFYMENIYFPVSSALRKRMPLQLVIFVAMFITFFIGSSFSHYVNYPASMSSIFCISLLTAFLVALHFIVSTLFRKIPLPTLLKMCISYLGIPLTWITVSYLWILDYAVLGLGWTMERFLEVFHL